MNVVINFTLKKLPSFLSSIKPIPSSLPSFIQSFHLVSPSVPSHFFLIFDMEDNSYLNMSELLRSQQAPSFGFQSSGIPLFPTEAHEVINLEEEAPPERKERRAWTPPDDIILISSWLNTSKDSVVGNEQKSVAFWSRIAAYYEASIKVAGGEPREASQCKQRWHKINDLVCKFSGAYEAATREKTSGQNENDVLKLAHTIFSTNHKKKFTLEYAWKELRNDQKWCDLSTAKKGGCSKRRKFEDGSHSASSHAIGTDADEDDQVTTRPPGVKASKARGKKTMVQEKEEFERMWTIKKLDLEQKERLSKMKLLESLIAKQAPLTDYEEALKKKFITDLLSN